MSISKQLLRTWTLRLLTLILTSSVEAKAGVADVLPTKTGAQQELSKLVQSGQFEESLMAWNSALGQNSFSSSDTGIALHAYLLAQVGLPVLASQWITSETRLWKIDNKLRPLVASLVQSQASHLSSYNANKTWKKIIDDHSPLVVRNKKDLNWLKYRLKKTTDINTKSEILWSLSVGAAKLDQVSLAEKYIKQLKELDQKVITNDKIEMQSARILFQKNKLSQAIDHYSMISKSSEFWLESIEERAWAYLRLANYDKARSDITTLLASTFKDYVSAEVYVLAAITNLKICDYPQILKDSRFFKERHMQRIREMEQLADKGVNTHIMKILDRMDQDGPRLSAAAGQLESLPRMALRSVDFSQSIQTRSQLLVEIKKAQQLKSRLQILGGNSKLDQLLTQAQKKIQALRTQSIKELKMSARHEVKEYRVMVNKLKLAEVEVIHRLNVDETLQGKRSDLGEVSQGRDTLVFPYTDEVWVDELDNYQARVKDCPTTRGASL